MALDPASQKRMKILKFLQDCGGLCSEEQWDQFDSGIVQLDPYMLELETSGYVRSEGYSLTQEGERQLAYLESVTDC